MPKGSVGGGGRVVYLRRRRGRGGDGDGDGVGVGGLFTIVFGGWVVCWCWWCWCFGEALGSVGSLGSLEGVGGGGGANYMLKMGCEGKHGVRWLYVLFAEE